MDLTLAQLQVLKAFIAGDATLAAFPQTPDGADAVAQAMNTIAVPDFFVWNENAQVEDVFNNITWANLTPADAPDGTQAWLNRALACQGKQFNLQTLLQGRSALNANRATLRGGLQDALTNLPSGTGGATLSAGWVAVRTALARKANRVEKLFADTSGGQTGATAQLAAVTVVIGDINYQNVLDARKS